MGQQTELKPLFIWERLTGKLLYESNDTKSKPAWHELQTNSQGLFERAAKRLNAQLSLCWLCGERVQLLQPHLVCEDCKSRVITQAEYAHVLNEEDCDFCSCCGDKTKIAYLQEAQMPDLERPEQIRDLERPDKSVTAYPPMSGFHVCLGCADHCEDGPCEPENLKAIVEDQPDLEPNLTEEEAYCDDHAYDQDTDIPVIRNWNDQRSLSEQELMEYDQGGPSEEPIPEDLEIARKALTTLLGNINNPQGECFQCHQPVAHKEQVGHSVYLYPCGHHYQGKLPVQGKGNGRDQF